MNQLDLVRSLLHYAGSGKLDPKQVQPVVEKLLATGAPPATTGAMQEALGELEGPQFQALLAQVREARRKDALSHHGLKSRGQAIPDDLRESLRDLPLDAMPGWTAREIALPRLQSALRVLGDRLFFAPQKEKAPSLAVAMEKRYQKQVATVFQEGAPWELGSLGDLVAGLERHAAAAGPDAGTFLPALKEAIESRRRQAADAAERALSQTSPAPAADLDPELFFARLTTRHSQAESREERQRLLDLACQWPGDQAAPFLLDLPKQPWEEERAAMILTLRFGKVAQLTWESWRGWLRAQIAGKGPAAEGLQTIGREQPAALLYLWYSRQGDANPEALAALERIAKAQLPPVTMDGLVERWAPFIPADEWRALTGAPAPAPAKIVDEPQVAAPPPVVNAYIPELKKIEPPRGPTKVRVLPPRPPPKPSVWEVHLKPFFLENWYMVAGVAMVLVGSSLLAYYTWDKHWLIRYTLMPSLLGAFTAALAWMGGWIERKDLQFKGTAAVLRSAAIGLLPINFMAVALLANDPKVTNKALAVPLMGILYLAVFGWGLRRWCSAVHPGLGLTLGGTLLFLNGLVTLAPLARSFVGSQELLPVVGTGFYLGFFALAASVVRFTRKILTAELAKEKRVVWFFGATLLVTFLQVFAWVHGSLHYLPQVQTYAPMVVLAGWLVLYAERRTLEFHGDAQMHGAESFLGFACILLGVLMGIAHPYVRIVTLVLAGLVWLNQSLPRRQALHYWIGLTFLVLGGASIGLLHGFPPEALPTLGIGLALGLGAFILLARSHEGLRQAAAGMQGAVLILTVLVTMLAQEHFGSSRLIAAAHLVAVSALFGIRAWRDQKIRWVQTAMVVLALAIPYLAGIDLAMQRLHSTTIVFGLAVLSFLWIGATLVFRRPLVLGARSTVLWIYGVMALACMTTRMTIDPEAHLDAVWFDLGGPVIMIIALIAASYFSRSLIPSGMAMLIGLVLTPELKEHMQRAYPHLGWGTGLGSSLTALGFMIGSFSLRRIPALRDLGDGDKYLGVTPYPLRRRDSSLFTLPMIASAAFLALKVETWNLFTNLEHDQFPVRLAAALAVSGVVWTLFAVTHREHRLAPLATYLGLFWMVVGIASACPRVLQNPEAATVALVPALWVQGLYFLHRFYLQPRHAWAERVLVRPTLWTLRLGSLLLSLPCVGGGLFGEDPRGAFGVLCAWVSLELAWHGLASRRLLFGFALFAVNWITLVAWNAKVQGTGVDNETSLDATLFLVIGFQLLQAGLELRKPFYDYLKPLMVPFQIAVTVLSVGFGVMALGWGLEGGSGPSEAQIGAILVALILNARALSSGPLALLAVLVGYILLEYQALKTPGLTPLQVVATPWRASFLAFTMAVLGHAGRRIYRNTPVVLAGSFTPRAMKWPVAPWMFIPAATLACVISFYHAGHPALRELPLELLAPYVGAATLGVIAFSTQLLPVCHGAGVLLTLGNVHLVRIVLGTFLRGHGIGEIHLISLGVALTLLQGTLIRLAVRREELARLVARSSLAWAGLILLLISANYLAHPNLAAIGALRFGVSGTVALLAGLYFRRAARLPDPGGEVSRLWCEGFYHFGVTMAFWCAALMLPPLRHPVAALVALGLPVLYFYARAESGYRRGVETFVRYRISAATLGFVVLALYIFRGVAQMIVFPDAPFDTTTYHANSPVIFILGLVLLRLHALGGTSWLAFYGGLATMTSTYFALTALPGLSPFHHPVVSAWCAIGLVHFTTLASHERSPLRTAIQQLSGIDAQGWHALRRSWGVCLLAAAHFMALYGALENGSLMVAPLILGAASVLIHQGVLRESRVYMLLAQVEIAIALHAGFLLPSYLHPGHVVWALLGLWAALIMLQPVISRLDPRWQPGHHAGILGVLTLAHVFYHHPGSAAGLWAFGLGAILATLTPRTERLPRSWDERLVAALLPLVPSWLVWFSQAPLMQEGVEGLRHAWPWLATSATLLATGAIALQLQKGWAEEYARRARLQPRSFDQLIAWLGITGAVHYRVMLWFTFIVTALTQVVHWGLPYKPQEMALVEGLYAAFGVAWILEGKARKAMVGYFLAEVCVLAAFLAAREQLHLTRHFWKYEYDIWASLVAFFTFVGTKQLLDRQPREVLVPLKSTLLALPVFSVSWIILHHLGTDLGLLVVGLHSAAFTYLGKDDRESPYHLVAIGGFVAFVGVLFWSKLHLAMLYAYVLPAGVGVLVLLQLFRARVPADTRNAVRAATLLAMLGSAGWSALLAPDVPLLHNVVLLGICLAAMTLGGLLRIRMYVALGFGALMIDLLTLLGKAVAHLDRSLRMTMVGSLVLVVGVALVFGAIYYKTHKAEIAELLGRWRLRFAGWD